MMETMHGWQIPAWISVWMLYGISALCVTGLVSRGYRDNVLQMIGMMGLLLFALGRADTLSEREHVSFYQFVSHLSLLSFGLGTALKAWQHRNDGKAAGHALKSRA